jgi:hypothetical protein
VHGGEVAPSKDGIAVEVVNALTVKAPVDGQTTATIDAKEAGSSARCVPVRALVAGGMEMLLQPRDALLVIEEVYDRKIHGMDLTRYALLV